MYVGRQFALFGPHRDIPHQEPDWKPEISSEPKDTSTQMWEGHKNPQLPMFLTAREIKHNYAPLSGDRDFIDDEDREEFDDEVWDRKAEEADWRGTAQDMVDQNWQFNKAIPLTLPHRHYGVQFMEHPPDEWEQGSDEDTRPQVLDGHHRIAAADDEWRGGRPDALIPVVHIRPEKAYNHIGKSADHL